MKTLKLVFLGLALLSASPAIADQAPAPAAAVPAQAQQAQPLPVEPVTLSADQVNFVLNQLGNMPYSQVAPTLNLLVTLEVQAQQRALAAKKH